jgi:hypothetical protein
MAVVDSGNHTVSERSAMEITIEDLEHKLKQQQGKCCYSTIPLNLRRSSDWHISLERLDREKGYVLDNIGFCILELNTGSRQWTKQKMQLLPNLLKQKVDMEQLRMLINEARLKPPSLKRKRDDDDVLVENQCAICRNVKSTLDFSCITRKDRGNIKYTLKTCKMCMLEEKMSHLRSFVQRMLRSARSSTKLRNSRREEQTEVSIDVDQILDKLNSQEGRCKYSNIPLQFGWSVDWQMSLERLDATKGYTSENVVLICLEFNTSHLTGTHSNNGGSAQWSKSKFDYFMSYLSNGE